MTCPRVYCELLYSLQNVVREGVGGRIPSAGRDQHTLLDRSTFARPATVVGQSAHADGLTAQSDLVCIVSVPKRRRQHDLAMAGRTVGLSSHHKTFSKPNYIEKTALVFIVCSETRFQTGCKGLSKVMNEMKNSFISGKLGLASPLL